MSAQPLDAVQAALYEADTAIAAAWATPDPTERARLLSDAARWLAAAQAANDAALHPERTPDAGS